MGGFHRFDNLIQHLKGHHKIDAEDKLPKRKDIASTADAVTENGNITLQAHAPIFPTVTEGADDYIQQVGLVEDHSVMHSYEIQNHGTTPHFLDNMQPHQQFDAFGAQGYGDVAHSSGLVPYQQDGIFVIQNYVTEPQLSDGAQFDRQANAFEVPGYGDMLNFSGDMRLHEQDAAFQFQL
ncbi:hypothetical protein F4677DRAFT_154853 [Hypoxylon crocopeplum]|nr:hypothetical protein F4677DRAFT_154853 [Hypoxylon crocopeplum]